MVRAQKMGISGSDNTKEYLTVFTGLSIRSGSGSVLDRVQKAAYSIRFPLSFKFLFF